MAPDPEGPQRTQQEQQQAVGPTKCCSGSEETAAQKKHVDENIRVLLSPVTPSGRERVKVHILKCKWTPHTHTHTHAHLTPPLRSSPAAAGSALSGNFPTLCPGAERDGPDPRAVSRLPVLPDEQPVFGRSVSAGGTRGAAGTCARTDWLIY